MEQVAAVAAAVFPGMMQGDRPGSMPLLTEGETAPPKNCYRLVVLGSAKVSQRSRALGSRSGSTGLRSVGSRPYMYGAATMSVDSCGSKFQGRGPIPQTLKLWVGGQFDQGLGPSPRQKDPLEVGRYKVVSG